MKISRAIPLVFGATLAASAALAAAPESSPTAPPTTITGKVDAVFGRQIVVATDSAGKTLVDLGRHPVQPPITVGETLQVSSQLKGNRVKANSLTRADGSTVVLRREMRGHSGHGEAAGTTGSDD